jgi:hypothetical protein
MQAQAQLLSMHINMNNSLNAERVISFQPAKLGAIWIRSMKVRPEPLSVSSRNESWSSAWLWVDVCKYFDAILVSSKICFPLRLFSSWSCLVFETWPSERSLRQTAHPKQNKKQVQRRCSPARSAKRTTKRLTRC